MLVSNNDYESEKQMSEHEQSALIRYGNRLNAQLNRSWIKPNLSGKGITAQVQFDVSANGKISNIRFRPSSGNAVFDNSVIEAFKSLGSADPIPSGQMHTFTMRFKLVD